MIGMEDQTGLLASIKEEEDLADAKMTESSIAFELDAT